jgi:hypothetical protein
MHDRAVVAGVAPQSGDHRNTPFLISGGALLALRMSLRARGLRGLDVLRRSQDRAPPATG